MTARTPSPSHADSVWRLERFRTWGTGITLGSLQAASPLSVAPSVVQVNDCPGLRLTPGGPGFGGARVGLLLLDI